MLKLKELLNDWNANMLVSIGKKEPVKARELFKKNVKELEFSVLKCDFSICKNCLGKDVPVALISVSNPFPFEEDIKKKCIVMFCDIKNIYGEYLGTQIAYEKCHKLLNDISSLISSTMTYYLCEQIDIIIFGEEV